MKKSRDLRCSERKSANRNFPSNQISPTSYHSLASPSRLLVWRRDPGARNGSLQPLPIEPGWTSLMISLRHIHDSATEKRTLFPRGVKPSTSRNGFIQRILQQPGLTLDAYLVSAHELEVPWYSGQTIGILFERGVFKFKLSRHIHSTYDR